MSSILIPPRIQYIDKNGEPIVGGKVYTYEAGTSVPQVSWKDQTESVSNTNPVILDDAGRAQIWIRGAYKIVVHDSLDQLIYEDDDVISYTDVDFTGLTATIADLNSTNTSGIVVTNNYSVQLADRGKTILANAASTGITVNLLAVTTATNRYRITIKKIDFSPNQVTVDPNGVEEVDDRPQYILPNYGDFIEVLCDGSEWRIVASQIRGTILSEALSFSVDLEDNGKFFNCDTNTGNVVVTLPAISTLGKGFEVSFKKIDTSGNSIIINPNGSETIDNEVALQIEGQNFAYTIKADDLNWYIISDVSTGSTGIIPNQYINGLYTSQVAPDPANDIQIEPGVFADSTNLKLFELGSPLIKELNNNWAEGNLAGGIASGIALVSDTWYHIFALAKANGEVDAGFDISITATNLLADSAVQAAGYIYYRRIASIKTDSSVDITNYVQIYDMFYWEQPTNVNFTSSGGGHRDLQVTPVLDVPPDVRVEALCNFTTETFGESGWQVSIGQIPDFSYFTPQSSYSSAPGAMYGIHPWESITVASIFDTYHGNTLIFTDTNQQIKAEIRVQYATVTFALRLGINTLGWKDRRLD